MRSTVAIPMCVHRNFARYAACSVKQELSYRKQIARKKTTVEVQYTDRHEASRVLSATGELRVCYPIANIFLPKYSSWMHERSSVVTDVLCIFSFASASDNKLVTRPKMAVFC